MSFFKLEVVEYDKYGNEIKWKEDYYDTYAEETLISVNDFFNNLFKKYFHDNFTDLVLNQMLNDFDDNVLWEKCCKPVHGKIDESIHSTSSIIVEGRDIKFYIYSLDVDFDFKIEIT